MYFKYKWLGFLKLSHLRDIQTLVNLPLLYVKIEELVGLPNLRKLRLRISNDDEYNTFNKLQCLSISFGYLKAVAIEITKVVTSCPHLQKLKLARPLVI